MPNSPIDREHFLRQPRDTPATDAGTSRAEPDPDNKAGSQTEPEQDVLKRAEDSGADATGGMGIATGIAQA